MKKNIDDIVFTDEILKKYKDDSDRITELCKKIDKNKKIQKEYKKYLKSKKDELEIHYNKIDVILDDINKETSETKITITDKEKYVIKEKNNNREFIRGLYC